MSMTCTPDFKRVNGVHPMSRDRENHVVFSWKRRWCLRFSWITEMLCIMNSFQKARPSTKSIIWALWDVCVKQFAKKDRICGQTTREFCTTITHRRTMLSLSVRIWLKTKRIPSNNNRIHLIWSPTTFSYTVDSRNRSAERVTAPEMRSWKNRRWLWWLYRKPIIKNVSRIESSAGTSALQSIGSTLKGTISIMMNKLVFLILKIKS